jgi:hypothetical protein
MRRTKPFPKRIVLAVLLLGLGLLFWNKEPVAASAVRVPSAHPAQLSPVKPLLMPRTPTGASGREERPSPPPQSPPRGDVELASYTPAVSGGIQAVSADRARLLDASQERSTDGLPSTATHCEWKDGLFKCGTCQSSADCAPNQGCLINRQTRRLECMDSECEEDTHCFPGLTCRSIKTGTSNAPIRRCVPSGERHEGESCDPDYISRTGACREGLRCINQVCTTPCRLDEPSSCPSGHTCMEEGDGPGCVPDCQTLGCPEGQQCKQLPTGDSRCLARVTGTCPETPCAEGERCLMDGGRGRGSFWCARVCAPPRPESCPSDFVCGWAGGTASACFRRCDPRDLDSCGEGWMCATISEDLSLWGCRPSAFN